MAEKSSNEFDLRAAASYARKIVKNNLANYIKSNNRQKLENLLASEVNREIIRNERYFNPFVLAIKSNQLDLFDVFLANGLKLLEENTKKNTNHSDMDSDMEISRDGDSNESRSQCSTMCTGTSSTILIEAIKCVSLEAVERLIERNVNVNSTNYRQIPLQIAYNVYATRRDKYLMKDVDDNNENDQFDDFQNIAQKSEQSRINKNCLLALNVNSLTYGKMQNALHLVNEAKKISTPSTNNPNELNLQLARVLVQTGCDLNHRDYISHETPIFRAITANNYELTKYLISEGANMSTRNSFGNDALSRSIQLGRFRLARLLIAADSPIRVYSFIYRTPHADYLKNRTFEESTNEQVNSGSFLQYSIAKYEDFLAYLQAYTQQPRSLLDLSRLCVRNEIRKPIGVYVSKLGTLPSTICDLILLKDVDINI